MKPLSPAEIVWMRASYDMLFKKRARGGLRELEIPRSTGDDNIIEPIPEGEWPWDDTYPSVKERDNDQQGKQEAEKG